MNHRKPTVALFAGDATWISRKLAEGLAARFRERDLFRLVLNMNHHSEHLKDLAELNADGVVLPVYHHEVLRSLKRSGLKVVNISLCLEPGELPTVGTEPEAIGGLAARHLLDTGAGRFMTVGMPDRWYSQLRVRGFCEEIAEHGFRATMLSPEDLDAERRSIWMSQINRDPERTGLFCVTDTYARDTTDMLANNGVRVPDRAAVVGVNNDELYCTLNRPHVSSVDLNMGAVVEETVLLMEKLLAGDVNCNPLVLVPPGKAVIRESSDLTAAHDAMIKAAHEFIWNNATIPLTVPDVASALHVSPATLHRRFKEYLGVSVNSQIRRIRLQIACQRLAKTHQGLQEIAEMSGFSTAQNLCRVFRQAYGTSPTRWRNM